MTLRELCLSEHLLDWRTAFQVIEATCLALADARDRGAVTLWLEPESFYVERTDGGWIATVLDAAPPAEPRDTEQRPVVPWLHEPRIDYWPPERMMGKPHDATTDVYTLGVIAFELVTGRRPFEADNAPALITKQLKETAPLASTFATIPRAADAVLAGCLERDRTRRFPDTRLLAQALAHVLRTEPIAVLPREPRPVRPPPAPRHTIRSPRPNVMVLDGVTCGSTTCTTKHRFRVGPTKTVLGSWLYLDHFDSLVARRPDYKPHPHVGIRALTYLFDGRLVHRDSLGTVQPIRASQLSVFHAGRGGVHSDRLDPVDRARGARVHGLELWTVLPRPHEDDPPSYALHRAGELPSVVIGGARVRVVLGDGFGATSPVATPTPVSMFDIRLPARAAVPLPAPRHHDYQRAVYVVGGAVEIDGTPVGLRQLAVIAPGASVGITATGGEPAHVVALGSAPLVGPRYTWWYFSATSKSRVEEAKRRYAAGELGSVPGEPETTPLPG